VSSCKISQRLNFYLNFADQLAEYAKLKISAQTIVDMVDPSEEGAQIFKTLVERLQEAPQRIIGYLSDNAKSYVAHVLSLVRSHIGRKARLAPLADGMSVECSVEGLYQILGGSQANSRKDS